MPIPTYARTRTLSLADLRARLMRQRARMHEFAEACNDNDSGFAECLSYDIEHTRDCIAKVEKGVPHVEYFDAAIGRWQDADTDCETCGGFGEIEDPHHPGRDADPFTPPTIPCPDPLCPGRVR